MLEFLFEDTTPQTHCPNPILSASRKKLCGTPGCYGDSSSHHSCAGRVAGVRAVYCECFQNRDKNENGDRIMHYFKESDATAGDGSILCPFCRKNC